MYFADGFVRHVLFMAMVLWNSTFLLWWMVWETGIFYGIIADGLVRYVHFPYYSLVKLVHFCCNGLLKAGTFSLLWSCETGTFLWWWPMMVLWNRYILWWWPCWWSCEICTFSLWWSCGTGQHFCRRRSSETGTFSLLWSCETGTFLL